MCSCSGAHRRKPFFCAIDHRRAGIRRGRLLPKFVHVLGAYRSAHASLIRSTPRTRSPVGPLSRQTRMCCQTLVAAGGIISCGACPLRAGGFHGFRVGKQPQALAVAGIVLTGLVVRVCRVPAMKLYLRKERHHRPCPGLHPVRSKFFGARQRKCTARNRQGLRCGPSCSAPGRWGNEMPPRNTRVLVATAKGAGPVNRGGSTDWSLSGLHCRNHADRRH